MSETVAIVSAAGSGERLGAGIPKAYVPLAGRTILEHAVDGLLSSGVIARVVVAAPPERVADTATLLAGRASVVAGGQERHDTVRLALEHIGNPDFVLVHDAARPLVPAELVDAVTSAVRAGSSAVIPVLPVTDTVKEIDAGGRVVATLDRSSLRAVQTPQGFDRALLERAHQEATADQVDDVTDDAGLVERLGETVVVVPGHEEAFKVTRPFDLVVAEAVLARRRSAGVMV